ncbi:MAG: gamma-glutamyltransferase family protein [Defluviitaleaceae bacterium]|nr:gamma-glutamyltransferase family protein [Defluviitaleaceae bacterium]
MKFDANHYPFASARNVIYGRGMVATSHPLASQAGLDVMKKGGNAIDAAIAAAACLTVVEPTSNGIGGDAFAIVHNGGKLHGLNASGPSPQSISLKAMKERGHKEMPYYGMEPITTPGVVAGWVALSEKFGKLPLEEVLAPAIDYAKNGHAVAPAVAKSWQRAYNVFAKKCQDEGEHFAPWLETFSSNIDKTRAPLAGEVWASKGHADTLADIANTGGKSFYEGALAKEIASFCEKHNGFLSYDDLASYKPAWEQLISINYHGYDIWQMPPNGQGLVGLIALNILSGYEMDGSVESYHRAFEAIKLAFVVGKRAITDPLHMKESVQELLSMEYAKTLRDSITNTAAEPPSILPNYGGTVYLAAADDEGNMISYIQSNYAGFGSGMVVPGTGIALQNRGADFSLDPNHINVLAGGKKTYHTIIPGFLTQNDKAIGPFGVMGGYMQPQGHLQVMLNTIHNNLNPQAALDAPRWQWMTGKKFTVEHGFDRSLALQLEARGHQITYPTNNGGFGRGQIIWRGENGILCGGTESRCDGHIAVW